jgi:hypothetical protein
MQQLHRVLPHALHNNPDGLQVTTPGRTLPSAQVQAQLPVPKPFIGPMKSAGQGMSTMVSEQAITLSHRATRMPAGRSEPQDTEQCTSRAVGTPAALDACRCHQVQGILDHAHRS